MSIIRIIPIQSSESTCITEQSNNHPKDGEPQKIKKKIEETRAMSPSRRKIVLHEKRKGSPSKHSSQKRVESPKKKLRGANKKKVFFSDEVNKPLVEVIEVESYKEYYDNMGLGGKEGLSYKKNAPCSCVCIVI